MLTGVWANVQQVIADVTENPEAPVCVDIPNGDKLLVTSSVDNR